MSWPSASNSAPKLIAFGHSDTRPTTYECSIGHRKHGSESSESHTDTVLYQAHQGQSLRFDLNLNHGHFDTRGHRTGFTHQGGSRTGAV